VTIYELRTALFWVITQRVVVISYREDEITIARCVKTQESADLSHFAAEAWNHIFMRSLENSV